MSNERLRCVVDASVGIKLFVDEPLSDQAHALFAKLTEDPPAELYVPDLFYIECTNILLKYMRRFGRSLEDSQADLADLNLLAMKSTPTADLMEDALLLASQKNLTAYDACYAVLVQRLDIPLITADEPMAKAIEWAIWLDDTFPKEKPSPRRELMSK
jgi:predicted nucleic acid-binding protein